MRATTSPLCWLLALLLAVSLLAAPFAAEGQRAGKVYRVGYLVAVRTPLDEAFREGLRELGYLEGQNLLIEYRNADGRYDRLPELAAELVRLKPDLIVVITGPGTQAVKQATTTIPIVMLGVVNPVEAGLVRSLAHPGGNVTGLSTQQTELFPKALQLLKEMIPKLSRLAWLWNPTNRAAVAAWKDIQAPAQTMGVALRSVEVRTADDFDSAFSQMIQERPDAVFVGADHVLLTARARIVEFTVKNRLPAFYGQKQYVEAGGLMFYGPDRRQMYRRAAYFVDRILKGAKPADLPVEQPMRFELVINLKTAKALGLTIPPSILVLADEVIQ